MITVLIQMGIEYLTILKILLVKKLIHRRMEWYLQTALRYNLLDQLYQALMKTTSSSAKGMYMTFR